MNEIKKIISIISISIVLYILAWILIGNNDLARLILSVGWIILNTIYLIHIQVKSDNTSETLGEKK